VAIVQPVFSLVTSSPEFFSSRKTPGAAIVAFALGITLGLPLAALLAEAIAERARAGLGQRIHDVLRAVLVSAIALDVLNELDPEATGVAVPGWLLIGIAAVCGLAALTLLRRSEVSRTFVRFLAVAAPAALVVFLASVPMPSRAAGRPSEARNPVPIVMVVMDELPTTSLLASNREIDRRRLPNFARLARDGTFYPNATTVADQTTSAVPSLLSGRRGPRHIVAPESAAWPQNLFALLRRQYRLDVREPITRLCPAGACPDEDRSTARAVGSLASETSHLAYLSVAPKDMAPRSPLIGGADERDPGRDVADFLARVRPEAGPTLDFLHVMAPHRPWGRLPSGRSYPVAGDGGVPQSVRETLRLTGDRRLALDLWRAHLLQVGYADRLLGRVIAHLRRTGMYDRALLVVAADHGVSFLPGAPLRDVTAANVGNIAPVPLFVKQPGGRARGTDLAPAQTIDVLPTILDVIDAKAPGGLDGVSLLGRVPPDRPVRVLSTGGADVTTSVADILRGRARSLRIQRREVIGAPQWRERCRLPRSGC
jgi:Sulfatase